MTIYNMGDNGRAGNGYSHPLHIHGTHFYLMKVGYPSYEDGTGMVTTMNRDIPCTDITVRPWHNPSAKRYR